ncbi:MAG: desulfoferrodoxin [Planctomycetota bacterium]|nr:MAG: desulfoferrodoxin [Planctomycetota bacterium]
MAEKREVYKCGICGNIVYVLHGGRGALVCCGRPMKLYEENTVDAAHEKHVPVVSVEGGKVVVRVGEVAHPMQEAHYIEWIEVSAGGHVCRKFLNPGDEPAAEFEVPDGELTVRAWCNLHGLWRA